MNGDFDLAIDSLNLRLPAGFGNRADLIARDAVRQLRRQGITRSLRLDALNVAPIRIGGGETDAQIAGKIARAIGSAIESHRGGPQVQSGGAGPNSAATANHDQGVADHATA